MAIGDVHGRWDLLSELIRAIDRHVSALSPKPSRLVVLGDFIDRGPSSRRVVDFLRRADELHKKVTVLQGNHEASLIESARGDEEAQRHWLAFGGAETLASYGIERPREGEHARVFAQQIVEGLGADTLRWIEDLPRCLHIPPFFFCHAGIRPGYPLRRQSDVYLQWIREPFLEDTRDHGAIIVHGHSMSDEVTVRSNRIGLDTGAHRTGVLSAAILDCHGNWIISVRAITRAEHRDLQTLHG